MLAYIQKNLPSLRAGVVEKGAVHCCNGCILGVKFGVLVTIRDCEDSLEIERGAARAKDLNDNMASGISNCWMKCAFGCCYRQ